MQQKYFMDYVSKDPSSSSGWRGIGCQLLDELPEGRKTCSEGIQDFKLTTDTELLKGHKLSVVKVSPEKPVVGYTIIYPMGGERTFIHPLDRK